jgi:hypothetical protein
MAVKVSLPHIGLTRFSFVPVDILDTFVDEVATRTLEIDIREQNNVFAGLQWLIPTAVVLFITRAYFDALFSELGKDHYAVLKRAAVSLYRRMSTISIVRGGTPGKIAAEPTYSMAFSIVATGEEINLKLLVQPELSKEDAAIALDAFFALIASVFEGTISPDVLTELEKGRVVGRTLLLAYDFTTGSIVTVDPLPPAVRPD